MNKSLIIAAGILFNILVAEGQELMIRGRLISSSDNKPLVSATLTLRKTTDSLKEEGATTNEKGFFKFGNLSAGKYKLRAFYMGHKPYQKFVEIVDKSIRLGEIKLEFNPVTLKDVTVEGSEIRTVQKGDTTIYNAKAYKTNPDANSEELIKKMPGVVVQNGKIQAHGEDLKKVLVDGQEFFGDDASIALKNIPSEIVDKVQIFDKQNDQSQFTGFNDGNTDKTINLVTKSGRNNGQFGKVYAGYGTDDRFIAGGSINYFSGTQRISLIGLSNNINQQNFSNDDILGVLGTSSMPRGGGPPGRGGPPMGRGGFGGGDAGNFFIGQQNGINRTHSYGINYSNKWGDKATINASYFFNNSINSTQTLLNRQYFITDTTSQYYNANNVSSNDNFNNRINVRLEYKIDSMNSFIFTPKVSFQKNTSTSQQLTGTQNNEMTAMNSTNNFYNTNSNGINFSESLLLRHRFAKKGRTISLNLSNSYNEKERETGQESEIEYYLPNDSIVNTDQKINANTNSRGYSANLTYTEPIGKKGSLQISYAPSYSNNVTDKYNYVPLLPGGEFIKVDTTLSNKYDFDVVTQNAGVSYRLNSGNSNFSVGANVQESDLSGDQTFPKPFTTEKRYTSLLPTATYQYKFSRSKNIRIFYRTSTSVPDISQLQDVVDNSNTLLLTTGNSKLEQAYSHNLSFHYHSNNSSKATSFFAMFNGTYTNNRIANSTVIPTNDTIVNGYLITKGAQLTKPVNTNDYVSLNSFVTFGFPVKLIKSNLNFNGGVSYTHAPSIINSRKNISETYALRGGAMIGSNISESIDFNLFYNTSYNYVNNTIRSTSNNNYITQMASARVLYLPWKWLVLSTDYSYNKYTGLTSSYNQEISMWNAGIGYKFLKNRLAELRFSVSDILEQNKSINRTVTETYVEDSQTQVISRFYLLTFTYNIKNFYAKKAKS